MANWEDTLEATLTLRSVLQSLFGRIAEPPGLVAKHEWRYWLRMQPTRG